MRKSVLIRAAFFGAFHVMLNSVVLAEAPTTNPFEEGIEAPKWSNEEIEIYKVFTQRAVARLQRALDDAKGKTFEEANQIYLTAIKSVVAKSFEEKARTELLLRYSLNAALDLTYGVPNPDGQGVVRAGVLEGIANKELLTVILEDSIELAIRYAEDDIRAIETNRILELPYGEYANQRLQLSRGWLAATFEWKAAYVLSVASLEHWATTIKTKENVHQTKYAESLERVREVLASESRSRAFEDPRALVGRVRTLRKVHREVLRAKINAIAVNNDQDVGFTDEQRRAFNRGLEENIRIANAYHFHADGNRLLKSYFQSKLAKGFEVEDANEILQIVDALRTVDYGEHSIPTLTNYFLSEFLHARILAKMSIPQFLEFMKAADQKLYLNMYYNKFLGYYFDVNIGRITWDDMELLMKHLQEVDGGEYSPLHMRNQWLKVWESKH